jgi:hypothetical protein
VVIFWIWVFLGTIIGIVEVLGSYRLLAYKDCHNSLSTNRLEPQLEALDSSLAPTIEYCIDNNIAVDELETNSTTNIATELCRFLSRNSPTLACLSTCWVTSLCYLA